MADGKDSWPDKALGVRALMMFVFYIVFNLLELVIGCIALVQLGLMIFTEKPNENLVNLGNSLGHYLGQIVEFLTFSSEDRPYPFGPWPK
jgi:hypothetical protein